MSKFLFLLAAFLLSVPCRSQELKSVVWTSFDVSFKAPSNMVVEEDSSEGYAVGNSTYYITVELLEGEGIRRAELAGELKAIAADDEVTKQTPVVSFDLSQFHGVYLKGICGSDRCVYSYLLAKDGSCGFYVSIVYKDADDALPETILRSFALKD